MIIGQAEGAVIRLAAVDALDALDDLGHIRKPQVATEKLIYRSMSRTLRDSIPRNEPPPPTKPELYRLVMSIWVDVPGVPTTVMPLDILLSLC